MFSGEMVTGPLLIGIFVLAIVVLLVLIIKCQLNAFVALLITAFATGILVNMPLADISQTVTDGFGGTLGSIGSDSSGKLCTTYFWRRCSNYTNHPVHRW